MPPPRRAAATAAHGAPVAASEPTCPHEHRIEGRPRPRQSRAAYRAGNLPTKHRNAHGSYYVKPGDSQRYRSRVEVARRFYSELFGGTFWLSRPAPPRQAPRPVSTTPCSGGGRLCLNNCNGKQGPCAFSAPGLAVARMIRTRRSRAPAGSWAASTTRAAWGRFGIGLPDAAATALVAAKKAAGRGRRRAASRWRR